MLSKNQIKFIRGLKKKKNRQANRLFLAEGVKVVEEMLRSKIKPKQLYFTQSYQNPLQINRFQLITEKELSQISEFGTPNQIFGVFEMPVSTAQPRMGLTIFLDNINDPGNLGTIIRLCDWFGVTELVCSYNTVDCYNPKVVQASMGSLARVSITYSDPETYLKSDPRPVFGTYLEGKNVYQCELPADAVLILGNEANGISDQTGSLISEKITIPQFGRGDLTESLNVAMATAIFLSEFRR